MFYNIGARYIYIQHILYRIGINCYCRFTRHCINIYYLAVIYGSILINLFYPVNLYEIPAKEFVKAKKLAREITPSEFEVDPDEWTKLCSENKGIRILEGGKKLVQEDYDHYDAVLKNLVTADW